MPFFFIFVFLSIKSLWTTLKEKSWGFQSDNRLRINICLQSWLIFLCLLFFIFYLFLFFCFLFSIFINFLYFFWFFRSNYKYVLSLFDWFWISIKDITSILAIISIQSPSYSFIDQIIGNTAIFSILFNMFLHSFLNVDKFKIVIWFTIHVDFKFLFFHFNRFCWNWLSFWVLFTFFFLFRLRLFWFWFFWIFIINVLLIFLSLLFLC